MTDLTDLQFFMTSEHECSYLPEERAASIFIDPNKEVDRLMFSELSEIGFRRSGKHIYRPHCAECSACIAIRIPVDLFTPSRSQKRCIQKNSDLICSEISNINSDEYYRLYERYITIRHNDGDMFPPSQEQYNDFLNVEFGVTRYIEFRDESNLLIALAVCDQLDNGLSAVYTFFDPKEEKRSLGVYGILFQIEYAKSIKLPYLYLGYWIEPCNKMNYKSHYRPFQLYINNQWSTFFE